MHTFEADLDTLTAADLESLESIIRGQSLSPDTDFDACIGWLHGLIGSEQNFRSPPDDEPRERVMLANVPQNFGHGDRERLCYLLHGIGRISGSESLSRWADAILGETLKACIEDSFQESA